jgi:hypothetical protein
MALITGNLSSYLILFGFRKAIPKRHSEEESRSVCAGPQKKSLDKDRAKCRKHLNILARLSFQEKCLACFEYEKKLVIYTQIVRVCSALSGSDSSKCYEIGTPGFVSHFGTAGI